MPEQLDPQKFYIMPQSTKKKILITGAIFFLFVLPMLLGLYYKLAIRRPAQLDKEISFEVKNGDSFVDISRNLYRQGAVNSEFLFALYVFMHKSDRNLQAGVYTIKAGTPIVELAQQLQHGINDIKMTFIEGWRVEEYARAASNEFDKIDYNEFIRKAGQYEGYLFPDTYYFEKDTREDDMIVRLKNNFDEKTKNILTAEKVSATGLTKDQVVTLASIVEREVNKEEDRPIVAGILLNRLKNNTLLGADATTQYAVAKNYLCPQNGTDSTQCSPSSAELLQFNWWPKVTQSDLDFDSPFNTRKVLGLPPHPICNPSLSSIEAVINFKQTDYLYYLTDKDGKTHYAKTLDEHNANIKEFLQ